MNALQGRGGVPELTRWENLAQHWGCTPAEAREQDENDVLIATTWLRAKAEAARQQQAFS